MSIILSTSGMPDAVDNGDKLAATDAGPAVRTSSAVAVAGAVVGVRTAALVGVGITAEGEGDAPHPASRVTRVKSDSSFPIWK